MSKKTIFLDNTVKLQKKTIISMFKNAIDKILSLQEEIREEKKDNSFDIIHIQGEDVKNKRYLENLLPFFLIIEMQEL